MGKFIPNLAHIERIIPESDDSEPDNSDSDSDDSDDQQSSESNWGDYSDIEEIPQEPKSGRKVNNKVKFVGGFNNSLNSSKEAESDDDDVVEIKRSTRTKSNLRHVRKEPKATPMVITCDLDNDGSFAPDMSEQNKKSPSKEVIEHQKRLGLYKEVSVSVVNDDESDHEIKEIKDAMPPKRSLRSKTEDILAKLPPPRLSPPRLSPDRLELDIIDKEEPLKPQEPSVDKVEDPKPPKSPVEQKEEQPPKQAKTSKL